MNGRNMRKEKSALIVRNALRRAFEG